MTPAELDELRTWVGSSPDDLTLQTHYDRVGSVGAVALAVLRARRADVVASPTRWSAGGDYSEDWSSTLAALDADIARLETAIAAGVTDLAARPTLTVGTLRRVDRERLFGT